MCHVNNPSALDSPGRLKDWARTELTNESHVKPFMGGLKKLRLTQVTPWSRDYHKTHAFVKRNFKLFFQALVINDLQRQ